MRAKGHRGGAKEWIDRRAMAILARTAHHAHVRVLEQHVEVWRCQVDAAAAYPLSVAGMVRAEAAKAIEDIWKVARRLRREVQHDEHRGGQIGRQRAHERDQRLDASG